MRQASVIALALSLVSATGGCGAHGGSKRTPDLARLPLVHGAKVLEQVTECDRSANAFCGIELVVADPQSPSSGALVAKERFRLRKSGWVLSQGDIPAERAASSPDGRLRVTYATAAGELLGVDLGWITRSRPVALALARAMFDRTPSMAVLLETGPT